MKIVDVDKLVNSKGRRVYIADGGFLDSRLAVLYKDIDEAPPILNMIPTDWICSEIENPARSDAYRNAVEELYYRWKAKTEIW